MDRDLYLSSDTDSVNITIKQSRELYLSSDTRDNTYIVKKDRELYINSDMNMIEIELIPEGGATEVKLENPHTIDARAGEQFRDDLAPIKLVVDGGGLGESVLTPRPPINNTTSSVRIGICVMRGVAYTLIRGTGNSAYIYSRDLDDDGAAWSRRAGAYDNTPAGGDLYPIDGFIYIVGFSSAGDSLPTIHKFDPESNAISNIGTVPAMGDLSNDLYPGSKHVMSCKKHDFIYIGGGTGVAYDANDCNQFGDGFCEFNATNGTFRVLPSLPWGIGTGAMVSVGDYIYVFGGQSGDTVTNSMCRFNITTGVWETEYSAGVPFPNVEFGKYCEAIVLFDKIYIMSYSSNTLKCYDVTTNTVIDSIYYTMSTIADTNFQSIDTMAIAWGQLAKYRGKMIFNNSKTRASYLVPEPLSEIRYTLNGDPVTENSTLFENEIPVPLTTFQLRAKAFGRK